jgi:hypothetical protein
MRHQILSVDPGSLYTAYVVLETDSEDTNYVKIIDKNKIDNKLFNMFIMNFFSEDATRIVVFEKVESYGMPVGESVFSTVLWTGRFIGSTNSPYQFLVPRKLVKMHFCGCTRAKDGNVIQALKDKYGDKGTKLNKGFFYGFAKDTWQAAALGLFVKEVGISNIKGYFIC